MFKSKVLSAMRADYYHIESDTIYIYIYKAVPQYSLIQYPRFTAARKYNWNIKEINGL
jgi:hypothetical protein